MIKKLTKDAKLVAKAVEKSDKLELNEEKNAIARKDHASFDLDSLLNYTSFSPNFISISSYVVSAALPSILHHSFDP